MEWKVDGKSALDDKEVKETLDMFSHISFQDKAVQLPTATSLSVASIEENAMNLLRSLEYESTRKDSMIMVYQERIRELEKGE